MNGQNGGGRHIPKRTVADMLSELDVRDLRHEFDGIAKRHGVLLAEVMGHRRVSAVVAARQECFAILRERGWSSTRIGALFDREHTTVLDGVKAHERRLAKTIVAELKRGAA